MRKEQGSHTIGNLKGKGVYKLKMICIDFYSLEIMKTQNYSSLGNRHQECGVTRRTTLRVKNLKNQTKME